MYAALLLADARLPTGGHAYSAGVEPALRGGLRPDSIRDYVIGRARTVSRTEAGTAVVALHALAAAERSSTLATCQAAWAARTPAPALRNASVAQARGYLRFARAQWPDHPAVTVVDAMAMPPCRAIVLGAVAAASEMTPAELVRLAIYDDAATACAALLKLEPRDPVVTSGWVLEACAAGEPFVDALAALTDPDAIPAPGAPQTEEWAQAHAVLTQRLFRA